MSICPIPLWYKSKYPPNCRGTYQTPLTAKHMPWTALFSWKPLFVVSYGSTQKLLTKPLISSEPALWDKVHTQTLQTTIGW